eukprot:scaffold142235_cov35-Tisochrysis_lutea.AAC.4
MSGTRHLHGSAVARRRASVDAGAMSDECGCVRVVRGQPLATTRPEKGNEDDKSQEKTIKSTLVKRKPLRVAPHKAS